VSKQAVHDRLKRAGIVPTIDAAAAYRLGINDALDSLEKSDQLGVRPQENDANCSKTDRPLSESP
jgi:hypothetical protein